MNNRCKTILKLAMSMKCGESALEQHAAIPIQTDSTSHFSTPQVVQQDTESSILPVYPDTLSNDLDETNSIADSQHNLNISVCKDDDDDNSIKHPITKMPIKTVEASSDSDSDSDSSSNSSSDSSSTSDTDFSSDDSVKDPNFEPKKDVRCSESEEEIHSPQPGSSSTIIANIEPLPLDIDAQPPSIESTTVNTQLLSRKRKANPENWKRNRTKALKNCGQKYTSMSKTKKRIDAKKMGPACADNCKLKCSRNFTSEQRSAIFQDYWQTGDLYVQRQFIHSNMTKVEPKYRYIRVGSTRQNCNHAYYLPLNSIRTRVCKVFFMNTLAISDKTVRNVVKKNSDPNGIPQKDNRGQHGNQSKLEAALIDGVKAHINSIPRIESHYCRAQTRREYIEGSLSVAALHRDYVDKCSTDDKQHVSYQIYYNIFVNDFNISFWKPKKDQCEDCTAYTNTVDKTLLQDKYDLHLKEKSLVRAEKETDKQNVSDNLVVCVYDLQAVMPYPRGEVSSFYYVSKLNLLNFTVTELGTNNTNCYCWHEGEGARGVNEIGSCVLMFLQQLNLNHPDGLDVIFYSDNCCGQQKNKFMLAMYQYALKICSNLKSITHKFLIKGHTQNEGDAAHSLIQRNITSALKCSPVYVPDQYITLIKTAKKKGRPFAVHELTHNNFLDLKPLAMGNYTLTEDGQKIKRTDIKVIKVHRGYENRFFFKTSYEDEEFTSVSTINKRASKSANIVLPKKLYNQKLKVNEAKKQGILKLIEKDIIPKYYQSFYENL